MLSKFLHEKQDYFFFVFRVIVGLLFFLHGWMKVPSIINGTFGLENLMFYAGIIETIGRIMIILGLFTKAVAFIAAIEMLGALFIAHFPSGLNPLTNGGEPAVLFFTSFLVLMTQGAGKWSIDAMRRG